LSTADINPGVAEALISLSRYSIIPLKWEYRFFIRINFYPGEQIQQISQVLKRERVEWLARFKGLNSDIAGALKS